MPAADIEVLRYDALAMEAELARQRQDAHSENKRDFLREVEDLIRRQREALADVVRQTPT